MLLHLKAGDGDLLLITVPALLTRCAWISHSINRAALRCMSKYLFVYKFTCALLYKHIRESSEGLREKVRGRGRQMRQDWGMWDDEELRPFTWRTCYHMITQGCTIMVQWLTMIIVVKKYNHLISADLLQFHISTDQLAWFACRFSRSKQRNLLKKENRLAVLRYYLSRISK